MRPAKVFQRVMLKYSNYTLSVMIRVLLVALVACVWLLPMVAMGLTVESFAPVNETALGLTQYLGVNSIVLGVYSNPVMNYLYVTYLRVNATGGLLVLSNGEVVGNVNLPNCTLPYMVSVDYSDNIAYVSCPQSNLIYIVNGESVSITGEVKVFLSPMWLYYDNYTGLLYAIASGSGKFMQYNPLNGSLRYFEVASTIGNLWPPVIVIPNGALNLLYVVYKTGYVLYLNYTTLQLSRDYCLNCIVVNLNSTPLYAYYDSVRNILFVSTEGGLYALDGVTGRILYSINGSFTWLTANVNEGLLYALSGDTVYVYVYTRHVPFEVGLIHLPVSGSTMAVIGDVLYVTLPMLNTIDEITFYKSSSGLYPLYVYVNSTGYNLTLSGPLSIKLSNLRGNVTLMLPNGIYNLTVTLPKGYYAQPSSVQFAIHDSTVKVYVPVYSSFKLIFTENGLALNDTWSVWVYGLTSYGGLFNSSTTAPAGEPIVFYLEPGSYRFVVNPVFGYSPTPVTGVVTVSSAGELTIPVNFTLVNYPVNINIINMPSGSTVQAVLSGLTIAGGKVYEQLTIVTSRYTLMLPDGSYNLTVKDVNYGSYVGVAAPVNNNLRFAVWGREENVSLALSVSNYPLRVSETGLPSGVRWGIYVSGTMFNGTQYMYSIPLTTPNGSVVIMVPDGSYTVSPMATYFNGYNNPYVGSARRVTVNGAGVNVTLPFNPSTYTLIIRVNTVLGLGKYTIKVVGYQFNGQPYTYTLSTSQALAAVPLVDGYYLVTVSSPYYITSYSTKIMINGVTPTPLSIRLIGILLVIIIIIAVGVAAVFMLRRYGYL